MPLCRQNSPGSGLSLSSYVQETDGKRPCLLCRYGASSNPMSSLRLTVVFPSGPLPTSCPRVNVHPSLCPPLKVSSIAPSVLRAERIRAKGMRYVGPPGTSATTAWTSYSSGPSSRSSLPRARHVLQLRVNHASAEPDTSEASPHTVQRASLPREPSGVGGLSVTTWGRIFATTGEPLPCHTVVRQSPYPAIPPYGGSATSRTADLSLRSSAAGAAGRPGGGD